MVRENEIVNSIKNVSKEKRDELKHKLEAGDSPEFKYDSYFTTSHSSWHTDNVKKPKGERDNLLFKAAI